MAINIQIGANSARVTTAVNKSTEAKNRADEAWNLAESASSDISEALTKAQEAVDAAAGATGAISNINQQLSTMSGDITDALTAAQNAKTAADQAQADANTALQEIEDIGSGGGLSPEDEAALTVVKNYTREYGNDKLLSITEEVDDFGNTYVSIDKLEHQYDFATNTSLDTVNQTLGQRITDANDEILEMQSDEYKRQAITDALDGWQDPPIATKAYVNDEVRQGVIAAENSIIQEVGDMIEGARELAGDDIDINALAIPTEESENSTNESFNELVSKLQEKPIRRSDVLKKVINEDAFYWYVMPVIDQRIYRDTVVNGVIVEAGWQKAVKERYWYHKQDTDIRDHYIYLYRSDINLNATKVTEENTAANNKPNFLPLRGNPRALRKLDEIPSGLAIFGDKINKGDRKLNPTVENATKKQPGLNKYAINEFLEMKSGRGENLPLDIKTLTEIQVENVKINGGLTELAINQRIKLPNKTIKSWFDENPNNKKKKLTDIEYPADFLYIGCYAECDDSSMYEKRWYKLTEQGEADETIGILLKRDDGSYYYMNEGVEVTVPKDERAEFYVIMDFDTRQISGAYKKINDPDIDYTQLTRRTFADVSRDIKVHMLPIYIPGSTIIAEESIAVEGGEDQLIPVTIDSILTPSFITGDNGKRTTVSENGGTISINNTTRSKNYICKENIRMANSGLPCVYGQGYTWLPLDAKGQADDNNGLGIHCAFTQSDMWIADGVYASYNGLIPSGYTKETLKNLATLYKYKIVEKFVFGEWSEENGKLVWTNNKYDNHPSGDGRIQEYKDPVTEEITYGDTTHPDNVEECSVKIFVDDYSEDNIADLNEEIFDVNIDDMYLSYTIKEGMMVQNGADGGATVSNFIYDTLSYLTQKGTINTNNIFMFCIEDDGDEYIFDEYIWEKGQVLKLNEQKRIKYSEDLRKVEYVQATSVKPIGHEGTFVVDGQQFTVHAYNGTIVEGETKDEQADNIIKYLSVLTQKDTGATIKNPSYVPAIPGNHVLGYTRTEEMYATEQMYSFTEFTQYLQEITSCGIITFIASSIKQALLSCYANQKDTDEIIRAFNKLFISDTSYSIGSIGRIDPTKWTEILGAITDPSHTDEKYSGLFKSQIEELYLKYSDVELTEALEIMFNDIFGPIIKPEEHPDDYDNVTNTYSDLINNYLKIVSYIKGEDGKKDTEEPVEPEGGIPVSVPEESVEEGETEEEILRWIANHYRSKFMYLIEFAILNKIINIEYPEGDTSKPAPKEEFVESINKLFMDIYETMKSCNLESYIKESYQPLKEYIEIFRVTFESSEYREEFRESFSESFEGVFTGSEIGIMFIINAEYNEYRPAQGGTEYIPVKTDVWIPITTEGGDYLQKYNKILAFLIDKEPVGTSNGFEWIYSLWRYMPSSKQYATIGTVSTISVNEPDLNDKDIENEVGAANNTDVHSEISNAIRVAREDIIQRYDKLLTEEGILSKLPKINKILEQNFISNTVGGETVYSLKNAITRSDLQLAVDRQNNIETNMSTLVNALNTGKRASYSNGVMIKLDENIFEQQTAAPNPPAPTAPQTLVIPEITGDAVVNNTVSTNTGKYFVDTTTGSTPIARRRIII